jgi:DNA-binding MarR family transcriptional regulator
MPNIQENQIMDTVSRPARKRRGEKPVAAETPSPGRDVCALDEEPPLGHVFFRVMRALFSSENPTPELEALPMAQFRLIWAVHSLPGGTMKDFAERLMVSQSTVTQLADRLVRRDLVERVADPDDRRVVRLRISETGKRILRDANVERRRTFHAIWGALSAQEQEAVMRGLELLALRGEEVRAAQGHPLPPWQERREPQDSDTRRPDAQEQPVMDIMARRVRGRPVR